AVRLVVLAQIVPGDAAAQALIADLAVEEGRASAAVDGFHRLQLHHRAFDIAVDLLVVLVLVMVGVDVDDQEILVVARARLLARMFERLRLRELGVAEVADLVADHVHERFPRLQITTKISSPRRTTGYLRSFSRRSPAHSPVLMSYS